MNWNQLISQWSKTTQSTADLSVKSEQLYNTLHPGQRALADDPAKAISLLSARRQGKTYGLASILLRAAIANPHSLNFYVTLTQLQADQNFMPVIRDLVQKAGINAKFRTRSGGVEIDLIDVNSKISIRGGKTKAEAEKLRGAKITAVVVDECASFDHQVFEYLLFDILEPALKDSGGTLYCTGTPGNVPVGLFYEMTTDSPGWSRHHWDYTTNTAVDGLVERFESTRAERGWSEDHPTWQREYLGKWTVDSSLLVLPGFRTHKNLLGRKSLGSRPGQHYVGGIYVDYVEGVTAAVAEVSEQDDLLVLVGSDNVEGNTLDDVEALASAMESKYPGVHWTARHDKRLGTLFADLLSQYYDVTTSDVETKRIHDLVLSLNTELAAGRVLMHQDSEFAKECHMLQWSDEKRKEFAPGAPCQVTHALLGLFEDNLHRQTSIPSDTSLTAPSMEYYQKLFSGEVEKPKGLPSFMDLQERKY